MTAGRQDPSTTLLPVFAAAPPAAVLVPGIAHRTAPSTVVLLAGTRVGRGVTGGPDPAELVVEEPGDDA